MKTCLAPVQLHGLKTYLVHVSSVFEIGTGRRLQVIGGDIGRVLTPVNDPHCEGPEGGSNGKEGDERGSQIKISGKLIGGMWMDGGGRDRSKEDRFDVVLGERVGALGRKTESSRSGDSDKL